jgi:acyl-CoA synthetase (NDP forming)
MPDASLAPFFAPRGIAVIGASEGVSATGAPRMGAAALAHLVEHGFPGAVWPVNPRGGTMMGRPVSRSLAEVPDPVDLAFILLPAEACAAAIDDCAARGIRAAVVFSSGFAEAGAADLEEDLKRRARAAGVRLIGPNTAGYVALPAGLVATISMVGAIRPLRSGGIAFVTQSGALGGSIFGRGIEREVGIGTWITTGNEADVGLAEYIAHLADDPAVTVIVLYLEGVRDGAAFLAAVAKAAAAGKPVVAYKSGRSEVAAAAVASHTGAMAGADRVFDGICRQHGIIRVDDLADLLPTARALERLAGRWPRGRNVAMLSASAGSAASRPTNAIAGGCRCPRWKRARRRRSGPCCRPLRPCAIRSM